MKSQRRAFTPEFKDEAVKFGVNTNRPVATVARELGLIEADPGSLGEGVSERIELLRLRKENNELK